MTIYAATGRRSRLSLPVRRLATAALVVAPLLAGGVAAQSGPATVVDLAVGAKSFKTLTAALTQADLVDALRGSGPFTVFAPTDDAFAQLPEGAVAALLRPENKDRLIALLKGHVVSGNISATRAVAAGSATTLAGSAIEFEIAKGALRVNGIRVVENDLTAGNGVVHVIDRVLLPEAKAEEPTVMDVLALAIDRGVPLFNNGEPGACAAIYEVATWAALTCARDELNADQIAALERGLRDAARARSSSDAAWALRAGIDGAFEAERQGASDHASGEEPDMQTKTLFAFDNPSSDPRWFSVNDDVMGGISRGGYTAEDGIGVFSGELSLENNGGFSSIRCPASDFDLGGYDGIELRVRGDGRTYSFATMRSDRRYEVNVWRKKFRTEQGEWTTIRMPFDELVHTVMGRRNPRTGPLPGDRVRSLAISVSDKIESPFRLEIDWIRAYRDTAAANAGEN